MRNLLLVLAALSVTLSACQSSRPRTETRLVYLGNDHLVGAARAKQQELDHQYCYSEAQLAFAQTQRQVAPEIAAIQQRERARNSPNNSGFITEFRGSTSDGVTYSGTAQTFRWQSDDLLFGFDAYQLGRRQRELTEAPRQAAAATYIRCMSSKGWLIRQEPAR